MFHSFSREECRLIPAIPAARRAIVQENAPAVMLVHPVAIASLLAHAITAANPVIWPENVPKPLVVIDPRDLADPWVNATTASSLVTSPEIAPTLLLMVNVVLVVVVNVVVVPTATAAVSPATWLETALLLVNLSLVANAKIAEVTAEVVALMVVTEVVNAERLVSAISATSPVTWPGTVASRSAQKETNVCFWSRSVSNLKQILTRLCSHYTRDETANHLIITCSTSMTLERYKSLAILPYGDPIGSIESDKVITKPASVFLHANVHYSRCYKNI